MGTHRKWRLNEITASLKVTVFLRFNFFKVLEGEKNKPWFRVQEILQIRQRKLELSEFQYSTRQPDEANEKDMLTEHKNNLMVLVVVIL